MLCWLAVLATQQLTHLLACFIAVCIPGYGQQGSPECTPCNYGSYHPGGSTLCTRCPEATFYAPVDGAGDTWTSPGGLWVYQ